MLDLYTAYSISDTKCERCGTRKTVYPVISTDCLGYETITTCINC